MERLNKSHCTSNHVTSSDNDKNPDNNIKYGNTSEIGEPNPSIATPSIPDEMPISENK